MIIGFTGTREGMSSTQKEEVFAYLGHIMFDFKPKIQGQHVFHHGDCIGADDEAARLAHNLGFIVVSHPSDLIKLRAYSPSHFICDPKPPLKRNEDIVLVSEVMLACPKTATEDIRSGTWTTIRFAKKFAPSLRVINP
jgi:hypothetical protein